MNQMPDSLDIREVARLTGLTSRALRFYEARGLLNPLRTHSGRRLYGRGELERIQQILALKRAGLSLSQIGGVTRRQAMDVAALVNAQLKVIEERKSELDEARALLLSIKSRIDRGEPVDAATFCSLIRHGETIMDRDDWKKLAESQLSEEQRQHWAEHPPQAGFDQEEYGRKWADLGRRVEAAIPLGPDSAEAQTLYDEWQALLAPFKAVATPQMMADATRFHERADEWQGAVNAPFSSDAFRFIQEIGRGRHG